MSPAPHAGDDGSTRLLRAVIGRPVSVSIAALSLVVLGVVSLWRLPVSLLPSLERPRLEVRAVDVDQGRDELLQNVVRPLERSFASLPGVLDVLSRVGDGEATVTVETEWQTDVDRLRIDAERRLAGAGVAAVDELTVRVESGDAEPILRLAVLGGSGAHARTEFARKVLQPELGRLPGAGDVRLMGTAVLQPVVRPRGADLAARGLTADDVRQRLERVGREAPLGTVRDGGRLRPLVVREPLRRLEDLASVRLEFGGRTVLLGDVADLTLASVDDGTLVRWRGRDVVLVDLHRAPGANAVLLAHAAREVLDELRARGDGRLRLELVHDASREVVSALSQLARAALIGLLLGTVVLRILLGRWRPTLSLAIVVPASMVAAFGAFLLGGISLDLVSLAGLALAAGMLVDNSIVVLEAIAGARERGEAEPVIAGTRQIAMALVASFVTTAVVFLPLIYLRGLARAFFGVQAFAIVSSLAISLLLSLSLTPVLSRSRRGRRSKARDANESTDSTDAGSPAPPTRSAPPTPPTPPAGRGAYLRLLDACLARPVVTLAATALLLAGAGWLLVELPKELVPAETTAGLRASLRMEPGLDRQAAGARLDRLDAALTRMAAQGTAQGTKQQPVPDSESDGRRLWTYRALEQHGRPAGSGELDWSFDPSVDPGGSQSPTFETSLEMSLDVPGIEAVIEARRGAVSAALERSGRAVQVEVSASTPERARALSSRVAAVLAAEGLSARPVRRTGETIRGLAGHQAAYRLSWRPLHGAGGSPELLRQVRSGLGGVDAGRTEIEGVEPAVRLEATAPADLSLLPVRVGSGNGSANGSASGSGHIAENGGGTEGQHAEPRVVPLAAVAEVDLDYRPPPDERRNGRPTVLLELARGVDAGRVQEILAALPLSVDESARLGGRSREVRRAFDQLRLALGLALVLVFLTVAALYESVALPLAVMATVPVAAAGAVGALAVTGDSFNVMAFLGLILLTGIVVNNGIVLIHRVEQLRAAGLGLLDAVRAGAAERYRPILMTTLTTLLGMLPLALLGGDGAELRRSLATAVCGGLVTSWAAALLVVPVFYKLLRR